MTVGLSPGAVARGYRKVVLDRIAKTPHKTPAEPLAPAPTARRAGGIEAGAHPIGVGDPGASTRNPFGTNWAD